MDNDIPLADWMTQFDERQLKEIEFSRLYAHTYHHGTDGHNGKMIIARMAQLLDGLELQLRQLKGEE